MFHMFLVVDPDTEVSPQHAAQLWEHLWAMRNFAPVRAMLPAAVSSPCPLLAGEPAGAVITTNLLPVPAGSAWVPVEIDLARYLGARGSLRLALLDTALRAAVDKGEREHDRMRWPSREQRADSRRNRRLSIWVRGWGEVVASSGADPAALGTLRRLQALAQHVAEILAARSRTLARQNGHCPAVDIAGARVGEHGGEMQERWRRAVVGNAVRHRNLLTLSPWDVFPRDEPADYRYTNLLPLLNCANSISFCRDVDICHWNVKEFKSFYERVGAILQCSNETPLIAEQV